MGPAFVSRELRHSIRNYNFFKFIYYTFQRNENLVILRGKTIRLILSSIVDGVHMTEREGAEVGDFDARSGSNRVHRRIVVEIHFARVTS